MDGEDKKILQGMIPPRGGKPGTEQKCHKEAMGVRQGQ